MPDGVSFQPFRRLPGLEGLPADEAFRRFLVARPEEREAWLRDISAEPVPLADVRLLPPVPNCPLYLFLHGNSPTIWKRQNPRASRWQLPRIPYPRIRPWAALSGQDAEIPVPVGGRFNHGCELGAVIGQPARRVPEDAAAEHLAGFIALNDGYLYGEHECYAVPDVAHVTPFQKQALDTLRKAGDGCAMMGPWITTREEVGDPYDCLLFTWNDGTLQNRAWSGSYLHTFEFLIAYLSRFMTLPTGAVLGLGAAGWDGCPGDVPEEVGGRRRLVVEIERVGRLETTVRRVRRLRESPLLGARRLAGLSAERPSEAPRALWVLRGGHRTCAEAEGIPVGSGISPLLYPAGALARRGDPLVLPPHATDIHLTAQLAAVIGPRPVYRVSRKDAMSFVRGVAPAIAARDASLAEPLRQPTAYERRAAWFLGGCGDGFFHLGPLRAPARAGGLLRAKMTLDAGEAGRADFDFGAYRFALAEMIEVVSRTSTLLPGDVLSLGPAGPALVLRAEGDHAQTSPGVPAVAEIVGRIGGRRVMRVALRDERDPAARDPEVR